MGKGLDVQLAEIYAAFLEKRKKCDEALLDIFDAIAAAKAKTPEDLEAVVRETIATAFRLGIQPYPPLRRERRIEHRMNDWLGRETRLTYWVDVPVPEIERTLELPEGYRITPEHLQAYQSFFTGRIAFWKARLSADEGPRWDRKAAHFREELRRRGLAHKTLAERAGISEKTVQRLLAGKPIRLDSLRALEKALES